MTAADTLANSMTPYSFYFMTETVTAVPYVFSTTPADLATGVAADDTVFIRVADTYGVVSNSLMVTIDGSTAVSNGAFLAGYQGAGSLVVANVSNGFDITVDPEIDFAVACAAAYVFSEYDATYTVRVGCDDLMTVRANGKKIHTFCGPGHASRGQKTLQVPLKSGWNEIVLKTANVTHDWGFYFEFVDYEETLRFALRPKRTPDL